MIDLNLFSLIPASLFTPFPQCKSCNNLLLLLHNKSIQVTGGFYCEEGKQLYFITIWSEISLVSLLLYSWVSSCSWSIYCGF